MKVIIFGGSGFLGSHVADALTSAEHEVTIFDVKESSYLNSEQKFLTGDILNLDDLKKAIEGHDIVYHMAGIADIDECHANPVDTVKLNILGTTNILQACVDCKVKKIVFASSAYVYSDAGSFYRISKQSCELMIESYQKEFGLDYVILRYGSLYGPRSDKRNSIYRILTEALENHEIVYSGTGDEQREFIHVGDAANLSVKVLEKEYENQNIILTGNSSIKYRDMLEMIQEIMHGQIKIEYVEKKSKTHYKLSPYSFSPKLGRKLVNNPHIDLGQGLLNLIGEIHHNMGTGEQEKFGLLIKDKNDGK